MLDDKKEVEKHTVNGEGYITSDGLRFKVMVLEHRRSFGRIDVRVTPVAGSGDRWMNLNGVKRE